MSTFLTVIAEILRHTPVWAWGILAGLVGLGLMQMRDQAVSRTRLLITPLSLGLYSLYSTAHSFGTRPEVLVAWLAGLGLVVAAQAMARRPGEMHLDGQGNIVVHGSVRPLLGMVSVFGLRYVTAIIAAVSPAVATGEGFVVLMALAYGALSGLFAGRALRMLRKAGAPTAAGWTAQAAQ